MNRRIGLLLLFLLPLAASQLRGYRIQVGEQVFTVGFEGSSMLPSLHPGDTLLCIKVPLENLKLGDILLHYDQRLPERPLVAHRVIEISAEAIRTKGDNNPEPDRYYLRYDRENEWYVGKVVGVLFTSSPSWGCENCG
ncbi:MAG: S26 family signal peptidase [Candidatus Hadarchaeales archaeon]